MSPSSARALFLLLVLLAVPALGTRARGETPQLINYEGWVKVDGMNFKGQGQFKFALVDAAGSTTYWSNDGTSSAGSEPNTAVTLTVTKGRYSVFLGDTALANMSPMPAPVFAHEDLRLRVWFNDGAHGSQVLAPDQRIMRAERELGTTTTVHEHNLRSGGTVTADAWQRRGVLNSPPTGRYGHTAVWTGSEVIIWGGTGGTNVNGGSRYSPTAESWTAVTAAGAPGWRANHTAVWTGREMIVWGASNGVGLNDGGRYDPATNSWTAVTTIGAPGKRSRHSAVWTGKEMIVWGGDTDLNDGGRYDPPANTWTPMTTVGAPAGRVSHTAVCDRE